MGCNNSHLRPLFRRCRRRSKNKDDTNCTPKRQANELMIDSNHVDANTSSNDILHGFQFIGSSMRQTALGKQSSSDATNSDSPCVPILAQSEISHSQVDFFKMLDEKIQEGPDYDSEEDKKDSRRLLQKNQETWNRKGTNKTLKLQRLANNSPSTARCQWEEEGDGG